MKPLRSSIMLTFIMSLLGLTISPAETAAQLKKMSTEELTKASSAILYGKCKKIQSEWNETKDIIFTTITVVPDEYIKGNLGDEAIITVPGGQVGDIVYEVSEMPVFTEGEEIFAFVWKHPSGINMVTGGQQGKLKIKTDKKTGKKVVEGTAIPKNDPSAKKSAVVKDPQSSDVMLLDDFTREVKGYLK